MENNTLQHHGVLGMHWGVRRYQPYRTGERVKGGREIGQATKVEQRRSSFVAPRETSEQMTRRVIREEQKKKEVRDAVRNKINEVRVSRKDKKNQETLNKASEHAKEMAKVAREQAIEYQKEKQNPKYASKQDLERWAKISKAQEKMYLDMAKKYSNTSIKDLNKKDLKEAKESVNHFLTNAEYGDYGKDANYLEDELKKKGYL